LTPKSSVASRKERLVQPKEVPKCKCFKAHKPAIQCAPGKGGWNLRRTGRAKLTLFTEKASQKGTPIGNDEKDSIMWKKSEYPGSITTITTKKQWGGISVRMAGEEGRFLHETVGVIFSLPNFVRAVDMKKGGDGGGNLNEPSDVPGKDTWNSFVKRPPRGGGGSASFSPRKVRRWSLPGGSGLKWTRNPEMRDFIRKPARGEEKKKKRGGGALRKKGKRGSKVEVQTTGTRCGG